jgi:hypothetical protein
VQSTPFVVGLAAGLLYIAVLLAIAFRRARRNDQGWIVAQLQRHGTVDVSVRSTGGTWNPTGVGKRIYVAGKARYTLDSSGDVHLHLQPKKGDAQDFVGPIPKPPSRKATRSVRAVLIGYAAFLAAGFAVGFIASGGSLGYRFVVGCIGIGVAILAVFLAGLAMSVGAAIHNLRRGD